MISRKSSTIFCGLLAAAFCNTRTLHAQTPSVLHALVVTQSPPMMLRSSSFSRPETLSRDGQYYDVSVSGLRGYLESIRESSPQVYAELDPALSNLESRRTIATGVLVGGTVASVASLIYAVAPTADCQSPSINDSNFANDTKAWALCNSNQQAKMMTFGLLGLGTFLAGFLAWAAISPHRADLMAIVNEHNRMTPLPLLLHLDYDPTRRIGFAGAALPF
jgi:hypothetical protein